MNTDKEKTEFLFFLNLLDANQENAYVSCMNIIRKYAEPLDRIEILLPNVGRLCYYQTFIEDDIGNQIPQIKIFYGLYNNKKIRVYKLMKDNNLAVKAATLALNISQNKRESIYDTNLVSSDTDIINSIKRNQKLFYKYHKKVFEYRQQYLSIKYKGK